jgi:hypothetical protein
MTFVILSEESPDQYEAKTAAEAVNRALADWDMVADPGYKLYAVDLEACTVQEFELALTVQPVAEGA